MKIEGDFVVESRIHNVWDFFLDIPQVGACVPGVESIEQLDEENIDVTLAVKVGPIKAVFKGNATLTDLRPPNSLTARGEGRDKNTASMVSATFSVNLNEIEDSKTEVNYTVDLVIRGRLGQFGQGVIRATAKAITSIFVKCIREKIAVKSETG